MTEIIRRKRTGEAWETVEDGGGGGGGGGLGVWKVYGVDAGPGSFGGIDIEDGVVDARWWTPAAVEASVDADPFLTVVVARFDFGEESAVLSDMSFSLPVLVDGSDLNIQGVGTFHVTAQIGPALFLGHSSFRDATTVGIQSFESGAWGDGQPGDWSAGDSIVATFTGYCNFYLD